VVRKGWDKRTRRGSKAVMKTEIVESIAKTVLETRSDKEWTLSSRNYLRRKYPDKFIAVKRRRVVASAKKLETVMNKLKGKKIPTNDVLIDYVSKDRVKYLL
jgi:hypothetical protein